MKFKYQATLIKTAREYEGLTQAEVAKALGVGVQFISNIERGRIGIPFKRIRDFCRVLKVSERNLTDQIIGDFRTAVLGAARQ